MINQYYKKAREKLGLYQWQVAEKVGISTRTYQRYEYGQRNPTSEKLFILSKILNVEPQKLINRQN